MTELSSYISTRNFVFRKNLSSPWFLILNFILLASAFVVDLLTPLGIADGILYLSIMLLTIWVDNKVYVIMAAAIAIVFTVSGYFLSPAGLYTSTPIINRLLSVSGIILCSVIILKYKSAESTLKEQRETIEKLAYELSNSNNELEQKVKYRTAELERSKQDLKKALEKEVQLNELKSRFVSMVSHEFRTPLTTVNSSASLISKYIETGNPEKQEQHVIRIKMAVNHLTDLLSDVLSISRLEEGRIAYSPTKFSIKELVTETINQLEPIIKEGQKIKYNHEGSSEICSDRKIVNHVLMNLISNAIKFSKPDSCIEVYTGFINKEVIIRVEDKGIGISDEDQQHLFERFFRGVNAANIQGTGLGLNIVAKYVEVLGGTISFKSKLGEGTVFTIIIPEK